MLSKYALTGNSLANGRRRGTYQVRVDSCLASLEESHMILGRLFDIAGFGWRCGISQASRKRCHHERKRTKHTKVEAAELWLFSCNPKPVCSDIKFLIDNQPEEQESASNYVALPFACIYKTCITWNQSSHLLDLNLMDTESSETLIGTLDLKNIRSVIPNEQWDHGIGLPNITLEIIDKSSIDKHLNGNAVFGVVSDGCLRQCRVYSGSLVRIWAEQDPDRRYLLCERCEDGGVIVKRCLNDSPMSESFGQLLIRSGNSSIIILEETKKANKFFQPVNNGSVFLFIKICEPNVQRDLTYLEVLQVQREMPVQKMLDKIFRDVDFPAGSEYNAYAEEAQNSIKEITFETTTIAEIGLRSGSNIIIRKRGPGEVVKPEDVQRDLRDRHAEQPERHEHAQCEMVKQEDTSRLPASVETCSNYTDELSSDCHLAKDESDVLDFGL